MACVVVDAQAVSSCGGVSGELMRISSKSADIVGVVGIVCCEVADVVEVVKLFDGCRCFGGAGEADSELETDL